MAKYSRLLPIEAEKGGSAPLAERAAINACRNSR
jgi:hypothetical protein